MASGTSYTEESEDPHSDIAEFARIVDTSRGGLYDFARSFKAVRPPGQKFYYASTDTEVLGALVARVTGTSLSAYMSERLWKPLGPRPRHAGSSINRAQLAARWRPVVCRYSYATTAASACCSPTTDGWAIANCCPRVGSKLQRGPELHILTSVSSSRAILWVTATSGDASRDPITASRPRASMGSS